MEKEIIKTVDRVIHIPYDFHHKNKSVYSLLSESGYFELHDQINQNEIIEVLKMHPNLVNEWLQWSEDKRTNEGWYFTKGDGEKCFVGHYPEGKEFEEIKSADKFYACAVFIKREIESIRT